MHRILPLVLVVACLSWTYSLFAQDAAGAEQVTLVEKKGSVDVRSAADRPWSPAKAGQVLGVDWEISTGINAQALLRFADNSEVTVKRLTEVRIADFRFAANVVKTDVRLKYGGLRLDVRKGTQANDFKVQTPVYLVGVAGTEVQEVSYYNGYGGKIRMGDEGVARVSVNPTRRVVAGETTDHNLTSPIVYGKLGSWVPVNFPGYTPKEFQTSFWWGTTGPGAFDNLRSNNPSNSTMWGQITGGNTTSGHPHAEDNMEE